MRAFGNRLLFLLIPIIATIIDLHMGYEFAVMSFSALPAVGGFLGQMGNESFSMLIFAMGILFTVFLWLGIGSLAWYAAAFVPQRRMAVFWAIFCALFILTVAVPTYAAELHRRRWYAIGYQPEDCLAIGHEVERSVCLYGSVVQLINDGKADAAFCESAIVREADAEKYCWGRVALDTADASLCMRSGNADDCYGTIAANTVDLALCEKILDESRKRRCVFLTTRDEAVRQELCASVGELDFELRNECARYAQNLAKQKLDTAVADQCRSAMDDVTLFTCWKRIGSEGISDENVLSVDHCSIAPGPKEKGACILGIAEVIPDSAPCAAIEDEEWKAICERRAGLAEEMIANWETEGASTKYQELNKAF